MSETRTAGRQHAAPATSGALQSPDVGGGHGRRRVGRLACACACALALAWCAPNLAGAAELVVNDTRDRVDSSIGNGICRTGANTCTLRAAVQEANALPGADVIHVPAGVYELEIPSINDDLPGTGDLDVTDTVTIVGAGATATILDGGFPLPGASPEVRGLDRLLEIHPTAGDVTIEGLTLRNGFSEDSGGAIQNWSPRRLRLNSVHVIGNLARKDGGGVNNADPIQYEWASGVTPPVVAIPSGRVEIVASTLSGNAAGGVGAAVNNVSTGTVSILSGSRVVDNPGPMVPDPAQVIDPLDPEPVDLVPGPGVYDPNAAAIANKAEFDTVGTIHVADSTVADNFAPQSGAGIQNVGSGRIIVERSTLARNTTEADGGAVYSDGGTLTVTGSTFTENLAHASGSAIYSKGDVNSIGQRGRVTIAGSTFRDGVAWAHAGAVYSGGDADVTVTDVVVEGNHAEDAGGGLAAFGRSTLTLTRGTFTGNSSHGEGGGLFTASDRAIKVADSTFTENTAGVPGELGHDAAGGGVYTETGPVEVSGSTITHNTSTEHGGGLYIDNHGDVAVADTVVSHNSTLTTGGGIENSGTRVNFQRLTVAGNRAGEEVAASTTRPAASSPCSSRRSARTARSAAAASRTPPTAR
jgi:predicted outer membrane repeat protein